MGNIQLIIILLSKYIVNVIYLLANKGNWDEHIFELPSGLLDHVFNQLLFEYNTHGGDSSISLN